MEDNGSLQIYVQETNKQQEIQKSQILTRRAETLVGRIEGSCVTAVRNFLGLGADEVAGLAKNTQTNTKHPEIGAVIVTNESIWGHVGVVLSYTDTTVTIYESNVPLGSDRAGIRTLKLNDPRIVGYRRVVN